MGTRGVWMMVLDRVLASGGELGMSPSQLSDASKVAYARRENILHL